MLGTAYLDDSADRDMSTVFVAAGFFCPDNEWKYLRHEWRKILKPHRIQYFRSYDCRTLTGEFSKLKDKWGEERARKIADKIRNDLEFVIEGKSRWLAGFGMSINLQDFYEVDAMPEARENWQWMRESHDFQTAAFRHIFLRITHMIVNELSGGNYIAFVCDDSTHYRKIRRGYERVRAKFPEFKDRMISLAPMDDKKVPQLQMADLMADVAREMSTRHIATDGAEAEPRSIKTRVLEVKCWNKSGMLKQLRGEAIGA